MSILRTDPPGGGEDIGSITGGDSPTSEWLGKRKPTPSELIRYYAEVGKSEDFARFTPEQVVDWITRKWDVAKGYFTNDFGDIVEKPTESGPLSMAEGYATGERDAGKAYTGGGGGNVAATSSDGILTAPAPSQTPRDIQMADMQRALEDKFLNRQGIFGFADARGASSGAAPDLYGKSLNNGGLWWGVDKGMFSLDTSKASPSAAPSPAPVSSAPSPAPVSPGAAQPTNPTIAPTTSTGLNSMSPLEAALRRKKIRPDWVTNGYPSYGEDQPYGT